MNELPPIAASQQAKKQRDSIGSAYAFKKPKQTLADLVKESKSVVQESNVATISEQAMGGVSLISSVIKSLG